MARYAAQTDVPVLKTRMEIEALAAKHGAGQFFSLTEERQAMIGFTLDSRQVRFELDLPDAKSPKFTECKRGSTLWLREPSAAQKLWEQECRSLWRALLLVIKAKLEAVAIGISTFEREFMANIVMTNGQLVHELVGPRIAKAYETSETMPLLPAPDERD